MKYRSSEKLQDCGLKVVSIARLESLEEEFLIDDAHTEHGIFCHFIIGDYFVINNKTMAAFQSKTEPSSQLDRPLLPLKIIHN